MTRRLLLPLIGLLWATPAFAQFALPGLGERSLEIPAADDPAQSLKRDLAAQEEALEANIQRMQERSRFFLERLDLRGRDLAEMEREYAAQRSALGRGGADRRKAITTLLEELRQVRQDIGLIEEEWVGHLDELAEAQSDAARYLLRVDETLAAVASTIAVPQVDQAIDQLDLDLAQQRARVSSLDAERQLLLEQIDLHRDLLEQARRTLRERDKEMLTRSLPPRSRSGSPRRGIWTRGRSRRRRWRT